MSDSPASGALRVVEPGGAWRPAGPEEWGRARPLELSGAALCASSYLGLFHPSSPADRALLLRGLDLLRTPGAKADRLVPVLLVSPHACAAAWVHPPAAAPGEAGVLELRCERGWLVLAGSAHPRGGASLEQWLARGFEGEWQGLVGADGAYSAAAHDAARQRLGLAHDRFGLFRQVYARRGGALWFATSTNALAAVPGLALEPNREHIAAMGINLVRPEPDSPFRGIERPLANTGHWFGADLRREVHEAPGLFPREHGRPLPRPEELTQGLNAALLRHLEKVLARPDADPVGVWLTSGVDSRWMAAGLRHLGAPTSYWTIGEPGSLDLETARALARAHGVPGRFGVLEHLEDVSPQLPETNWILEGRVSLAHQLMGALWEELRRLRPLMLHGYFPNWMKWLLPDHAHRRAERLGRGRELARALEDYVAGFRRDVRKYEAHLLLPGIEEIAEQTARALLERSRPEISYHLHLAVSPPSTVAERSLALARLSHAVGGADVTLMDSAIVELGLEASRLPYPERRFLHSACIVALDPGSAELPTTPWSLPPRAMARGMGGVVLYAATHPGWLPRMAIARRRKTISPNPIRMRLLGSPRMLAWARELLLRREGRLAHAFGDGVRAVCDAVEKSPRHRSLGFLYGLVSLELYLKAFAGAAAGKEPAWGALELPG